MSSHPLLHMAVSQGVFVHVPDFIGTDDGPNRRDPIDAPHYMRLVTDDIRMDYR